MKNIMKSVEIEMNLKHIDNEIKELMNKIDIQLTFIDIKYKDRLRDKELIDETTIMMDKLLVMANRVKDLEFQAIKNDDLEVYWKCEQRIAHVVETMEYIRNKYMF
jgi:hypothetical protein